MAFDIQPCPDCWGDGKLTMNWNSGRCLIVCDDCGEKGKFVYYTWHRRESKNAEDNRK